MSRPKSGPFATRLVILIACLCLGTAGCATPGKVMDVAPESLSSTVKTGDQLIVTLQSGEEKEFVVTKVDDLGIYAKDELIPYGDISSARILKSGNNGSRNAVVIAVIAAVAACIWLYSSVNEGLNRGLFE